MAKISDSFPLPLNALNNNENFKGVAASGFDGMFNANIGLGKMADELLLNLNNQSNDNSTTGGNFMGSLFPFSSAFESTFGLAGPLPTWINMISGKLGLSQEQNLALQDIAVRNKDITKTPESVQKISNELKKAGIGA